MSQPSKPAWRRDTPPRGVRCLVTCKGPDSWTGAPRVRVASVSRDHDDVRWFSDGCRLHIVMAWMLAPEPARDEEPAAAPAPPGEARSR